MENFAGVDFTDNKINFVGSIPTLTAVFDCIDKNIFNCNLDGVKLEWCDELKTRAAVSYEQYSYATKQTYIRFSKAWFKNRTRKNFVEAVLYEMTDLLLSVNSDENDDDIHVFLLEAAFSYFNNKFKTNLRVNYNYKDNDSSDGEVEKILNSVARERKISSKKASYVHFRKPPVMKVLTKKHFGRSQGVKCPPEHGVICYCPSQLKFRERFQGSNIYAIYTIEKEVKCFLCDEKVDGAKLQAHFQKECYIFNP